MEFKLKIVESWFSNDYVHIEYKTKRRWRKIKCAKSPNLPNEMWEVEYLTYSLGDGNFMEKKKKFNSIKKIKAFEEKEFEKIKIGNIKKIKEQEEAEIKRQEAFKRANSK